MRHNENKILETTNPDECRGSCSVGVGFSEQGYRVNVLYIIPQIVNTLPDLSGWLFRLSYSKAERQSKMTPPIADRCPDTERINFVIIQPLSYLVSTMYLHPGKRKACVSTGVFFC